jgi:DnaJ like chaperone protein
MFGPGAPALADLLAGLFHIAGADGALHEAEEAFLARVADIFGVEANIPLIHQVVVAQQAADQSPFGMLGPVLERLVRERGGQVLAHQLGLG